jgi:hypothetical protein
MTLFRNIILIIGLILTVVFAYLAYNERNKDNSNLYQAIKANIVSVRQQPIYDNNTLRYTYDMYVQYTYNVNNLNYTGEYLYGNYPEGGQLGAYQQIMAGASTPIDIFYEKANPGKSVRTYAKNNLMTYIGLAVVSLVVGLIFKFSPPPTFVVGPTYVTGYGPAPVYGPSPGYGRY